MENEIDFSGLELGLLLGLSVIGVTMIVVLLFTWGEEMISNLIDRFQERANSADTLRRSHVVTLRLSIEEKRMVETLSHERSKPGARISQEGLLRDLIHKEARCVAIEENKDCENASETADRC